MMYGDVSCPLSPQARLGAQADIGETADTTGSLPREYLVFGFCPFLAWT